MQACMSSFKKKCDLYSYFKQVCFNFHLPYLKFSIILIIVYVEKKSLFEDEQKSYGFGHDDN